jgi:hypothetical protein
MIEAASLAGLAAVPITVVVLFVRAVWKHVRDGASD